MLLLLDTHTFIWFINGDTELSAKAIQQIQADDSINFISIASIWEISIKISLEKLELKRPFAEIETQILQNGFQILPVTPEDCMILSALPFHHRDPFDRMIISQSIHHNISIITKDDKFKKYNTHVIW